ncbi:sodium/nucleoside cotransporter 2 [Ixodes scapularis]
MPGRKFDHSQSPPDHGVKMERFSPMHDEGLTNAGFVADAEMNGEHREHLAISDLEDQQNKDAKIRERVVLALKILAFLLYHGYLIAGIKLTWNETGSYCHDVKFLVVVTAIVYICVIWKIVAYTFDYFLEARWDNLKSNLKESISAKTKRGIRIGVWAAIWIGILAFLVVDSLNDPRRLVSVAGAVVLIFLGYVFSKYRQEINWYQVMWAVLLQFLLGLIVLRWPLGREALQCFGDKVKSFLDFTFAGSTFVFGYLAKGFNLTEALGDLVKPQNANSSLQNVTEVAPPSIENLPPLFVFQALPVIFFFSFIVSILYFYGIMQWLVLRVGSFLQLTIGTTVCESMTAAANIFLGMTEAPLVIRPFLPIMTKSELHTVMTGGFATIAGSVMAAYIGFGVSPSHLLTASIMSAPAALAFSKLLYPEVEESKTNLANIVMPKSEEKNVLEAASNGTTVGLTIIGQIVANVIGFLAFIAFLNSALLWFGSIVKLDFLTFEWLLSMLFTPLAYLMGVPWKDSRVVGELVGIKTFANEFIAYAKLAQVRSVLEERSVIIATYALCGFSNLGSLGITLGALGALCPERKSELATMSVRALCAGSAACFLTACVAGSMIE